MCDVRQLPLQEYNFHPKNWKIDIYMRYILYSAIKDGVRKVPNFIIVQMNSLKIYHTVKALNFHVIHNQQNPLKINIS